MAYVPNSGSVVAFQSDQTKFLADVGGLNKPTGSVTGNPVYVGGIDGNGSVVGARAVTVVTIAAGDAWLGLTSVSGTVTAPPGSVMNTVHPAGSITSVTTPAGSILATSAVQPAGSLMTVISPAGSVMAVRHDSASVITVSKDSSVISLQLAGSILATSATINPAANQSVSGAVTTQAGSIMSVTNPAGSVTTVIATNPAGSITSITTPAGSTMAVLATQPAGSLLTAIQLAGSIMATSATVTMTNSSVMLLTSTNVIGSVATLQGTNPWVTVRPAGSVTAVANIAGSIAAVTATAPAGSVMTIATLAGSIMAVSATAPAGSIMATNQVAGSIMAVNATQPAGSLLTTINPAGSVTAVIFGNSSLVGTYGEDTASADADKGLFILGVRNDTVASLTSASGDYGGMAVDAVGRSIIKPFAGEDATIISYVGSTVSGSVQLIQASAVGKKSYITDFWLSNTGVTTTLVTLQDGSTSILGQFIAPTGGGMVSTGINIPLKTNNSQDLAFKVSPSTSVLYLAIKGYQAQ